jgi:hypothetical protein
MVEEVDSLSFDACEIDWVDQGTDDTVSVGDKSFEQN